MQVSERELSWNARIIENFHEHGGHVTLPPFQDSNLLLLTTTGATSGQLRTSPLGFTRDGVQRQAYRLTNGTRADLVMMAILKTEWEERRR